LRVRYKIQRHKFDFQLGIRILALTIPDSKP